MAAAWRATTNGYKAALSAGAVVIAKPAGLAVGDTLVAHLASSAAATWTGHDGSWTEQVDTNNQAVYTRYIADASDLAAQPSSYNFTASSSAGIRAGTLTAWSGALTSSQIDVVAVSSSAIATPVVPSATTTTGAALLAQSLISCNTSVGNSLTPPGGVTRRFEASPGTGAYTGVGDTLAGAPGATGTFSWTEGASGATWNCALIAVKNPPHQVEAKLTTVPVTGYAPTVSEIPAQEIEAKLSTVPVTAWSPAVSTSNVVATELATVPVTGYGPAVVTQLNKARCAILDVDAGTGSLRVIADGDSVSEWFSAGPGAHYETGWGPQFAFLLADRKGSLNTPSLYMPAATGASSLITGYPYPEGTDPWTRVGAVVPLTNRHGLQNRAAAITGNNGYVETTDPGGYTNARVLASGNGGIENIEIRTNGQLVVDDFILTGDQDPHLYPITLDAPGKALRVTMGGGSFGNLFVSGVIWDDHTHGPHRIEVIDAGHAGLRATQAAGGDITYIVTHWPATLAQLEPHLVIIELGINDAQAGTSAAAYQTALATVVSMIDAACAGNVTGLPDYLFLAYPYVDAGPSGGTTYSEALWAQYVAAMKAVSESLPWERTYFLDLQARGWFPPQYGPTVLTADGVHPNVAGSEVIARALVSVLDPTPQSIDLGYCTVPVTAWSPAVTSTAHVATSLTTVPVTAWSPAVTAHNDVAAELATVPVEAWSPAVSSTVHIPGPFTTVPVTAWSPAVTPGPVTVATEPTTVVVEAYAPTVTPGTVEVHTALTAVSVTAYAPAVAPGPVGVTSGFAAVPVAAYAPMVRPINHVPGPFVTVPVTTWSPLVRQIGTITIYQAELVESPWGAELVPGSWSAEVLT